MDNKNGIFDRAELLLGADVMKAIASRRVIIFGVGGVGSWCAECLVRSGIRRLTIVDPDCVCPSNVNRQIMATSKTIGEPKVEALRQRLTDINPAAEITAMQKTFREESAGEFGLAGYDYIVDAIDSLKDKAALILYACQTGAVFFSSMGAARKMDATRIQVAEFWKVRGCPLGAALRKKFKRAGAMPGHKFSCVYGEEVLDNRGTASAEPKANGSMVHITAIFGMTIGGLILNDIYTRTLGQTDLQKGTTA